MGVSRGGPEPLTAHDIEPTILRATGGVHPLDVTLIDDEDLATPWKRQANKSTKLAGTMPAALTVTLANLIFFGKSALPQALANRLIHLAGFQTPIRQGPGHAHVVGQAARNRQRRELPATHRIATRMSGRRTRLAGGQRLRCDLRDERCAGEPIQADIVGTLRLDLQLAVEAMVRHDAGVLRAPTAFGKTVKAAIIARRGVNTPVLVHRTELLKQWQERLQAFLGGGSGVVGTIDSGKAKPTGKIDVAVSSRYRATARSMRRSRPRADRGGRMPPAARFSCGATAATGFARRVAPECGCPRAAGV